MQFSLTHFTIFIIPKRKESKVGYGKGKDGKANNLKIKNIQNLRKKIQSWENVFGKTAFGYNSYCPNS